MLENGYSQTSVDSVCAEAGVTKGSLYHFFKTKEDLGLAVLDGWITRNASILQDGPHQTVTDPVQAALVYVQHVEDSASRLWHSGCFVGSLSMDIAGSSDRMQQGVEAIFRAFVEEHAILFEPVLAASSRSDLPSPTELAELFLSSIEGSIVMAKAYRNEEPIRRTLRSFNLCLQALLQAPTPTS